jgi:hypothetical protein
MKSRRGARRGNFIYRPVRKSSDIKSSYYSPDQLEMGQKIYPMVLRSIKCSDHFAGKVTGMILELEKSMISDIIGHPHIFERALEEAIRQLDSAGKIVWKGEEKSFACLCTEGLGEGESAST